MNWTNSRLNVNWWDSQGGDYRIVDTGNKRKPYRLMSFIHEDEDGKPMIWDFATLKEAQEYTEVI